MKKEFIVTQKDTLLNYLYNIETGYSKSKLKSLLKNRCISINGKKTSQFDAPLRYGAVIEIAEYNHQIDTPLKIVYEDTDILVIDKPYGMLTVSTQKKEDITAYRLASAYVKSQHPRNRIFVVHRLDRDTSGILILAKNEKTQALYQKNWNSLVKERLYLAIVEGVPMKESDTITSFLRENKTTHMYSTTSGQEAITHYRVLSHTDKHALLAVTIDTGRKNQIRVHMFDIGHPIIGDRKYEAQGNPLRRMGLHAYRLIIQNPETKKLMTFSSAMPHSFYRITNIKPKALEALLKDYTK